MARSTTRLFTRAQAETALPAIRALAEAADRRYRRVRTAVRALEHLRGARDQGLPISGALVARKDVEVAVHLRRMRRLITALEDLGPRVVEFDPASIEFPAAELGPHGFSYYCWRLGDPGIAFLRHEGEAFEARHRLEPA